MSQYKKFFTVSFDDGLEQDKRIIELMRNYGIRGTFNLNSELFGRKAYIRYSGRHGLQTVLKPRSVRNGLLQRYADADRIPADEIRQIYAGMEIASHGAHHLDQSKLTASQLQDEILKDREKLQAYTDMPVTGHVFPYGKTSEASEDLLRENGFLFGRGILSERSRRSFAFPENPFDFSPTCRQTEKDFEDLANAFIAARPAEGDLLFCVWGHGYEFDFPACKGLYATYERIFAEVAERDDIIKCTNGEVFSAHRSDTTVCDTHLSPVSAGCPE